MSSQIMGLPEVTVPTPALPNHGLNNRDNFSNFVAGQSNQIALSAARQVAEQTGPAYNFVLIIGDYGLGKTHLLNAIGRAALENRAALKVRYLTGETYINRLINATQDARMAQFRQNYRSAELLLLDDLEALAGKERSQEEFKYTLDELLHQDRQVVLSAHQNPAEIKTLGEGLRARLQEATVVKLAAPEEGLRRAFLQKLAAQYNLKIEETALERLVASFSENLGQLRGGLNSLLAYAQPTNRPLTVTLVEEWLALQTPAPIA